VDQRLFYTEDSGCALGWNVRRQSNDRIGSYIWILESRETDEGPERGVVIDAVEK